MSSINSSFVAVALVHLDHATVLVEMMVEIDRLLLIVDIDGR
jgi:hypothetical protein